jgi:hypothetical protein
VKLSSVDAGVLLIARKESSVDSYQLSLPWSLEGDFIAFFMNKDLRGAVSLTCPMYTGTLKGKLTVPLRLLPIH